MPNWQDLPFREIWCVDTEFYFGNGLANGDRVGDPVTPLCLVAHEMRTGRTIQLWQDEFGRFPPYRMDDEALFIAYNNVAEYGTHIALGWGQPACSIDAYVEFRLLTNNGAANAGERKNGFYSEIGALRYFKEDTIERAYKKDMTTRILQGPPFTNSEREDILEYCGHDVEGLARLVRHIVPTIRSLSQAMSRAKFCWATAKQMSRGVPMDGVTLNRIRTNWDAIKLDLVEEKDREFVIYEVVNGKPHWRSDRFAEYVRQHNMNWPRRDDGKLSEDSQTFREMGGAYPHIEPLRELRATLSEFRLEGLEVGKDGRNRTPLWQYGTKTARNTPGNSKFVFGPAKWIRFLISPPPGRVLVHRDYKQQEVRIAAVLSGDDALLHVCEAGDVYLGIAEQLGFLREGMSGAEREAVRGMFKTVVLGIQYGLGAKSLAMRTGMSPDEAREILARLRARYRKFEEYCLRVADRAGLDLELSTPFGWRMGCPPGINARTVRNFPIQSTGSEILHVACVLAERRGIEIVAPVHDAIMAEAPADEIEGAAEALDRVMRDAAAVVLRGYELPTDSAIVGPGERYHDKRGVEMWNTVQGILRKLEEKAA